MPNLQLDEFIASVKKELLDYQQKHEDEPVLFELKDVELEVTLTATYDGQGKVNLAVVELGSDISREHTHTVRLGFSVSDTLAEMKREAVRRFNQEKFAETGKTPTSDEIQALHKEVEVLWGKTVRRGGGGFVDPKKS